jgi:HTH-type transcriptional regulator/antitoxin HigA
VPATSRSKSSPPASDGSERYLELVREFPLRPVRSDAELGRAIAMIDRLSDLESLAPEEADYLEVLSDLVESYESEHDPEPAVSAADMLRHLIEAKGVPQVKVAADTGVSESTISEILAGKRAVSRKAMLAFADYFRVEPVVFL